MANIQHIILPAAYTLYAFLRVGALTLILQRGNHITICTNLKSWPLILKKGLK